MINIDLITSKYDPKDYAIDYSHGSPVPWIAFDDFLPVPVLSAVQQEIEQIPEHVWSVFNRNGSFMKECNNLKYAAYIRMLTLYLLSSEFISWLENLTGLKRLIGDPHLIGAGLVRCATGHNLKLHTDFNWNEQLRLNRALSLILYVSREWDQAWGGDLEFWKFDLSECVHRVAPLPNRLLIWHYDERLWHGHPNPINCPPNVTRDGLRLFYFQSNATPITPPHRSLYWYDRETQIAYDKKDNK